jgi:hypothetical protein
MKTLNITFEDREFHKLERLKNRMNLSWELFMIKLAKEFEKIYKK